MADRQRTHRGVELIGVPIDLGANERGVGLAPTAFRLAGLAEKVRAEGIPLRDAGDLRTAPSPPRRNREIRELREVCERLADRVHRAMKTRRLPVVIGGDHSVAVGTIAGAARFFRGRGTRMGLLWVDAHADMNTPETTPSGNIHGMPLAISLGSGPRPLVRLAGFQPKVEANRCALVGIRNLDRREKDNIARFGVRVLTMKDIDQRGLQSVLGEALDVVTSGADGVHVSFDMDAVDPSVAPGVGTPVAGGLSYREAHLVMELVHDAGILTSLEVVEANPVLDMANSTAKLGTELILSALGKSIY